MNKAWCQAFIDLMTTPPSLIPVVVGVTSAIITWGLEWGGIGYLIAVSGVVGGVGMALTRMLMDPNKVFEESNKKQREVDVKRKNAILNTFDKELKSSMDWDVRRSFQELRSLCSEFSRIIDMKGFEAFRSELKADFNELHEACLDSLRKAHDSLITIRGMENNRIKKHFKERRSKLLTQVTSSLESMTLFVAGVAESADGRDSQDMERKADELKSNLELMKQTEADVAEIIRHVAYE